MSPGLRCSLTQSRRALLGATRQSKLIWCRAPHRVQLKASGYQVHPSRALTSSPKRSSYFRSRCAKLKAKPYSRLNPSPRGIRPYRQNAGGRPGANLCRPRSRQETMSFNSIWTAMTPSPKTFRSKKAKPYQFELSCRRSPLSPLRSSSSMRLRRQSAGTINNTSLGDRECNRSVYRP